jgi:hypothetical protein
MFTPCRFTASANEIAPGCKKTLLKSMVGQKWEDFKKCVETHSLLHTSNIESKIKN